jgi:hypothetical protein
MVLNIVEKLFFRKTLDYFEWHETTYLLKYKDKEVEIWLAAAPFPVNSQNPTECTVADELFVRYGDDKDLIQELPELIDLKEKDKKLTIERKCRGQKSHCYT